MLYIRYLKIIFFFAKVLTSLTIWELILPRLGLKKLCAQRRSNRLSAIAIQYRKMSIEMGGLLIKVGQFLSARVDILPREVTAELTDLQDEVTPEEFTEIRKVVEAEFGLPLDEKYLNFDPIPLAAASLGQAHLAKLHHLDLGSQGASGEVQVVVKVQRPAIENIIAIDLAALRTVGRWLNYYPPIRKRMNVVALLDEFTRTLYEEIDYLTEGKNAEIFAANFADQADILVPEVIWSHTTRRVLTLQDVRGIKITDYEAIRAAGINRAKVASRLLDTYLQQIFKDGFFHADPHPGNLFVCLDQPKRENTDDSPTWQLTFVDFGMVGRIPAKTRSGIREMLIGVGTRDTSRLIKAYQMLDLLLPGADLELIAKADEELFKHFWGKNMTELTQFDVREMQEIAWEFRDLIYDLPFQVPQDIIFLFRAVGILSGMCTGLDPEFNVWEHLAPYSRQLLAEEAFDQGKVWLSEFGKIIQKLIAFPSRVDTLMLKLEQGQLTIRNPDLVNELRRLDLTLWRLTLSLFVVLFIFISALLFISQEVLFAGILAGIAVALTSWMVFHKHG